MQKYQRPDTSSEKLFSSKKFDCREAVSLSESVTSEKVSIKRAVEEDEGEVKGCSKFLKGCNEVETSATFNKCTFKVSKEFKL